MFSATKFVVAGAIVALFGGFLLAGVLTQPSEESVPAAVGASPSTSAQTKPSEEATAEAQPAPESVNAAEEDSTVEHGLLRGSFRSAGSLSQERSGHTATLLRDGRVLVLGGRGDGGPSPFIKSAEIWDPATESFGPAGQMVSPRGDHAAALLPDGRVLVVGGYGDEGVVATAEVWDPATESFSPAGDTSWTALMPTATALPDGLVLVVGGWQREPVPESPEIWQPQTETFSPADSTVAKRSAGHTATLLPDGRVLVIGGEPEGGSSHAEMWDPDTGSFDVAGPINARGNHTATLLADGNVLVVGGARGMNTQAAAYVWNSATTSFEPTGSLDAKRHGHGAALISDGRVLIVGGNRGTGSHPDPLASVEVWDPSTGTFAPAAPLPEPRVGHTVSALPDGRVLVVGGGNGDSTALVWDPTLEPGATEEVVSATTPDLLPGVDLVTEEVEPGAYRVLSDGAGHDLVEKPPVDLTVAPDGEVVVFGPGSYSLDYPLIDTFSALGQEPWWDAWPEIPGSGPSEAFWFDAGVDHSGRLWARLEADCCERGGRLGRHDGLFGRVDTDAWTLPTWPDGSDSVNGIEVTSDGAVWLTQATSGPGPKVARIDDGDWTVLSVADSGLSVGDYHGESTQFAAASDGTAWLSTGTDGSAVPGLPGLLHFDGERWTAVDLPVDQRFDYVGPLALGADGTIWVYAAESSTRVRGLVQADRRLLRLKDGQWTIFENVPVLAGPSRFGARLAVDADGSLWIAFNGWPLTTLPAQLDPGPPDGPPRSGEGLGVLSFDGSTWRQYLAGQMVNRVGVAPDGSVWATSLFECTHLDAPCEDAGGGGVYVITPEAVAGTE